MHAEILELSVYTHKELKKKLFSYLLLSSLLLLWGCLAMSSFSLKSLIFYV